jgi:hypothetical protein
MRMNWDEEEKNMLMREFIKRDGGAFVQSGATHYLRAQERTIDQ